MAISALEKLEPAKKAEVMVYQPYYPRNKHELLPLAIALHQKGFLEGEREIEGNDNIPFVATWHVSRLPSDVTRCRLQFDGQADLSYQMNISNSDLIKYLIEIIENYNNSKSVDFNQDFYRKLLQVEE